MKKIIQISVFLLFFSSLLAQRIIIPEPPFPPPRPFPRPHPGLFELDIKKLKVETKIKDLSAVTTVEEDFYNPTQYRLQGYFLFPLPVGVSIHEFSMYINGKETQGELLDAKKAKKIYEDIVRKSMDPALLEYHGQNLLRLRVFPIQPRATQKIKLTYTQSLEKDNGTTEYLFPFRAAKDKKIAQLSFKIEMESKAKIQSVFCPTHEVEIKKEAHRAVVGFEGKNIAMDNNIKVYFHTGDDKQGLSLLTYDDGTEDGFFMMNFNPGIEKERTVMEKDIVFVLDASGSMAGEKMDQAKKALSFCVENLNEGDRFNIIRFSTGTDMLFDALVQADKPHIDKTRQYIKDLKAMGGTNIGEALELAISNRKADNRPFFVIFLTDGKPTIGETDGDVILEEFDKKNTGNTRVFTVGIGTEINTHFLDKLVEKTNAYRTYVLPEEDIEIKISGFFTKIALPVLTNIELLIDGVKAKDIYPKKLPDIFKGSNLTVFGRYKGAGKAKIVINGVRNGTKKKYEFDAVFEKNKENKFVASLWGTRSVGFLLDQIRLHGENKELKEEIIRLSKKYGIITPYTSYLIIEDEITQVRLRNIDPRNSIFQNRLPRIQLEENAKFSDALEEESGSSSVHASKRIQDLNVSKNMAQARTRYEQLSYLDDQGTRRNQNEGIKNVNGRAFYQQGDEWTDVYVALPENQHLEVVKVQFKSKQYFDLLNNHQEAAGYLALGQNVRFLMDGKIWEVTN